MGDLGVPSPEIHLLNPNSISAHLNSVTLPSISQSREISPLVQKEILALSPARSQGGGKENAQRLRKKYKVPCPAHQEFDISNMCTAEGCLEPLCAECIRIHTILHNKEQTTSNIDTIYNKKEQCLDILIESNKQLQQEMALVQQLIEGEGNALLNQCLEKIQKTKEKVIQIIQQFFHGIEEKVKNNILTKQSNQVSQSGKALQFQIDGIMSKIKIAESQLESDQFIPAIIQILSGELDTNYETVHNNLLQLVESNQRNFQIAVDESKLYTISIELSKLLSIEQLSSSSQSHSGSDLTFGTNNLLIELSKQKRYNSPLKKHNQTVQANKLFSQKKPFAPSSNDLTLKQRSMSQNLNGIPKQSALKNQNLPKGNPLYQQNDNSFTPSTTYSPYSGYQKGQIQGSENKNNNSIQQNNRFQQNYPFISENEKYSLSLSESVIIGQQQPLQLSNRFSGQKQQGNQNSQQGMCLPPNQSSVSINSPDYFELSTIKKYLHFFQDNSKILHYLDLENLSRDQKTQTFHQIVINSYFKVPLYHRSLITPQGDIYLFGGIEEQSNGLASSNCYKFNFRQQTLDKISSMHFPRSNHGVVFCANIIYAVGGNQGIGFSALDTCEKYDISQGKWEVIASMKTRSSELCLSTFSDQYIFKFGGMQDKNTPSNTVERYDIYQNTWTVIPFNGYTSKSLPSFSAVYQVNPDEVILFGGSHKNDNVSAVWIVKMFSEECDFIAGRSLPLPGSFWQNPIIIGGVLFSLQNVSIESSQEHCNFGKKRVFAFNSTIWKLIGQDSLSSSIDQNNPSQSSVIAFVNPSYLKGTY